MLQRKTAALRRSPLARTVHPTVPPELRAQLAVRSGGFCEQDLARVPEELQHSWEKQPNGCIYWTRWTAGSRGYRIGTYRGRKWIAHRLVMTFIVGAELGALTVDHICHNRDETCAGGPTCQHRRCVNPAHLELVARGENTLRGKTTPAANLAKTHCPKGHLYDMVDQRGWRKCRTCANDRRRGNRGRPSRTIPDKLRAALRVRSGNQCEARLPGCAGKATDACHRISRKMGGRHDHDRLSNLWHGCRACHAWATANPTQAYEAGLALKEHQDPEREPMAYQNAGYVVLADDGTLWPWGDAA